MKWYPIETAPRDVEFFAYDPVSKTFDVCHCFVLRLGGVEQLVCVPVQSDGDYAAYDDSFLGRRVTLWSPLPTEEPSAE